jgi:hypothetical protein
MLTERTLSISRPFPQLTIFPSGSSFKESRRAKTIYVLYPERKRHVCMCDVWLREAVTSI